MLSEAEDFRQESRTMHGLLTGVEEARFAEPTQFKAWTIDAVLQHLTFWNEMARLQIEDEGELLGRLKAIGETKGGMRAYETAHFSGAGGRVLLETWREGFEQAADLFAEADPEQRLKWAGPEMSARSSITARLMETWAHGQEVYDHLGVVRENIDRIRPIATLGVMTYSWTFRTRRQEPPKPKPHVRLTALSGDVWAYSDPSEEEYVEGSAEEFCQVVTQTRNIADTSLKVTGENANAWMSQAQCFAGPPHDPPAPGTRFTKTSA